ncbi:GNAT family N-acetyltransferase [Chromatiales bacterium (ex Bugula neritina AB1)]|nr:GNAT family N-acetyltransferase [Chromatiales bacterium (ex Bugula neritina AB1)]
MGSLNVRHSNRDDIEAIRTIYSGLNAVAGTLQLPFPSEFTWEDRLLKPAAGIHSLIAQIDEEAVGHIGFSAIQNPRRKHVGTFGMAVKQNHEGKGVGSALLGAALDLADNWLNLRRVELTVYTDNEAAIALYKKFGFIVEGESEMFAFRDGEFVNSYYMARVRRETS